MKPHVHIGAVEFVAFLAMLVVALFTLRAIEITWPDSPIGRALIFLHG